MPHLRSSEGVAMLRRYVVNWSSVLMVYSRVKKHATVRFKDGTTTELTKEHYDKFYETLYRKHLQDNGFQYPTENMIKTPDGLQILLPNATYSLVFDEIYLMKIYGMPDLTNKVVIDIGASIGDTALFFKKRGAKAVYGYELDGARVKLAEENIALNGMNDSVIIYNKKAAAEDLNKLMSGISEPIFLKIDCEGCEYEVLPSLDMAKVSEVIMEYHGEPQPLANILKKEGFQDIRIETKITIISAKR